MTEKIEENQTVDYTNQMIVPKDLTEMFEVKFNILLQELWEDIKRHNLKKDANFVPPHLDRMYLKSCHSGHVHFTSKEVELIDTLEFILENIDHLIYRDEEPSKEILISSLTYLNDSIQKAVDEYADE